MNLIYQPDEILWDEGSQPGVYRFYDNLRFSRNISMDRMQEFSKHANHLNHPSIILFRMEKRVFPWRFCLVMTGFPELRMADFYTIDSH
jgi:hypothetical protein